MSDLDKDGKHVPLDFQLGYNAGLEHGRADQRDHKAPALPEGQGLWWDGWLQGYSNGYRHSYLGFPSVPVAASNDPKDRAGVSGLPPALTMRLDKVRPLFAVIEYSSFYAVRHLPTSAEVPMGDGVDALFQEGEEGLGPLTPGTEGFVRKWEESLNANPQETLEAYFPELVEQEEQP